MITQVCDGSEGDSEGDADPDSEWFQQSMRLRHGFNMPRDERPWIDSHYCEGVPNTPRYKECIMLAFWAWLRAQDQANRSSKPDWFVDISQSLSRKPWGASVPTVTRKALIYGFAIDRCLDAQDFRFRTW